MAQERRCFVKVVAIGDSGVGKTSLIQMFEHSKFTESFKPTIGADFSNKEISINGRIVTLQIWDTAGQERYQSLGTAFYRGADCCLLVYDITNPSTFENILTWKTSFLQKSMVLLPDNFPFIVVGNKLDLEEENRQVSSQQLQRFCYENGNMLFIEASAKQNQNVEAAFMKLSDLALKRQEQLAKNTEDHISPQKQASLRQRDTSRTRLSRANKPAQQDNSKCFHC